MRLKLPDVRLKLFDMTGVLCYGKKKISVKKSLDSDFFTRLFVSERKQIALMADEKSHTRVSRCLFATSRSEMEIIMRREGFSTENERDGE